MKIKILFIAIVLQAITISLVNGQQMVKVNRWVSPVTKDFTTIPENKSTDAQLTNFGYTSKIFQYEAYLSSPGGNNVTAVNRWEMGSCREFIILAEHEATDQQLLSWGYKNKQLLFYGYKTRPSTGNFVAVNRWVNTLPQGNNCRDFTLSVAEHELTDAQLISWGYSNKLIQFYVPDPRTSTSITTFNPNIRATLVACVTVYEQPDYQGRSASFCTAGVQQAPFPIRSMRIPQGYDVYSTNAGECFGGMVYTSDINHLPECTRQNKIGILAIPSTKPVEITFRDISYNIHNGDCKKMYGTVGMSITLEDQGLVAFQSGEHDGFSNLLYWEKGPLRDIMEGTNSTNRLNIVRTVRLDPSIWTKCKLKINTNLGSAHKGCEWCTDFTWDIKMPSQQTYSTNFEAAVTLYSQGSLMPVGRYAFDNRHSAVLYFGFRKF